MAGERLWIDFLNSVWHDWRGSGRVEDRLDRSEYVASFLEERGLPQLPYPDKEELAALKALRGLLREQAERLAEGRPLTDGLAERLNAVLANAPVTRRLMAQENVLGRKTDGGGGGQHDRVPEMDGGDGGRHGQVRETDGGDRWRVELVPLRPGWPAFMGGIAASFADTLAEGGGQRVRICGNPDCRWVFSDDTRSRTKRYCEDKSCGNLMKVRRFRSRSKETRGDGHSGQ